MKETMYLPEHGKIVVAYYSTPPVWVFWLLYAILLYIPFWVNRWIPSIDSSIYIVFLLSLNYVVMKWIKSKDDMSHEKDE